MVKISSHFNNLVLVLIAIQVTRNEARRINSEVSGRSSNVTYQKVNDEKLLSDDKGSIGLVESQALTTNLSARQGDTRAGTYSYFYVGSLVWHIPLWFTLWFSFYVAFNVVRAIYGHKVINFLPFVFSGYLKFIQFQFSDRPKRLCKEKKRCSFNAHTQRNKFDDELSDEKHREISQ